MTVKTECLYDSTFEAFAATVGTLPANVHPNFFVYVELTLLKKE